MTADVSPSLRTGFRWFRAAVLAALAAGAVAGTAGCTATPEERATVADEIARSAGLSKSVMRANGFAVSSWSRFGKAGEPVDVYFEGDGFPWSTRYDVSSDPTPLNPVALRLAAADNSANVLYVARPCQYRPTGTRDKCEPALWTSRRFAEPIIESVNAAVDQALAAAGGQKDVATGSEPVRKLTLIGYSGGGAVAVLVAARRTDVAGLVTVAGNLAHGVWTAHQNVSPLSGSLDPIDSAPRLKTIPQLHLIGAEDTIVPRLVADSYARRAGTDACIRILPVLDTSHQSGWLERWPNLLRQMPTCAGTTTPNDSAGPLTR